MKIYISMPVIGQTFEAVRLRSDYAAGIIRMKGHEAVSRLDVQVDPEASDAEMMGNCLRALLESDGIVLLGGWGKSRVCRLEHKAAQIFGKQVFFVVEGIPDAAPAAKPRKSKGAPAAPEGL